MSKIYKEAQKVLIWLGVSIMDGTLRNFFSEITKCIETLSLWVKLPEDDHTKRLICTLGGLAIKRSGNGFLKRSIA
jgi:hypothetical protein